MFHFTREILFGQLLYTFGNFLLITLAASYFIQSCLSVWQSKFYSPVDILIYFYFFQMSHVLFKMHNKLFIYRMFITFDK